MICEACHQNLATVHLTEIVQKQKKELHLCEECARGKGDFYKGNFSVAEFLGGLQDPKKKTSPEKAAPAAKTAAPKPDPIPACPSCGLTFADFRTTGRLGCANDYEHFKKSLLPLLEKIHGATQHTGKVPGRLGQKLEKAKVLSALRKDLNLAIQREEYERAAELRDKIKHIEEGPG
jgi:protein arginine kinase activator